MNSTLTALKGVKVGHSTHADKLTGCTVVLFDRPYPVAYKSYGGDAATFNVENMKSGSWDYMRSGLFITGGSYYGLSCASSIMEFMVQKKIGFKVGNVINPALSGAVVFDLGIYTAQYKSGYGMEAAKNASGKPVEAGNVGAGTGTTVGKFSYTKNNERLSMKAGVGSARIDLGNGVTVCALSVVNALGNVVLPDGNVLAGNRHDEPKPKFRKFEEASDRFTGKEANTTISIVGINVDLESHSNYEAIAHMASQGQTRTINPINTSRDGDTAFVFSTEEVKDFLSPLGKYVVNAGWQSLKIDIIGQAAANAVQQSIYDACRKAGKISFDGAYKKVIPSCNDY